MKALAPAEAAEARSRMVERQLRRRGIVDERVLAAMSRVPRELFVPEDLRSLAYEDGALPIGHGQTISQPYIVATICSLLELSGDEHVLDVGTGSGYQAAVLAELAAEVVTIERVPELAERARVALAEAGYDDVEVGVGDGSLGVPDRAPFDGIAVAAAAPSIPQALYDQLAAGGRLVLPRGGRWGQDLVQVVRTEEGPVERKSVPCRFVPLVGAGGFRVPDPSGGGRVELASTLRRLWAPRRRTFVQDFRVNAWVLRCASAGTGSSSSSSASSAGPATSSTSPSSRGSSPSSMSITFPAAVGSFLVAVTNNYWWNRHWTFREQRGHVAYQGMRFLVVSTLALGANLLVLHLLVSAELDKVLAQAIAIVLVTPVNFVGNKLWSFGPRR